MNKIMNKEHQENPRVQPGPDWVEIDHSSSAVSYDTEVRAEVLGFFDEIIDPIDELNRWLIPKPGVAKLNKDPEHEEDSDCWRYSYRYILPDGREAWLRYGDAAMFDGARNSGKYHIVDIVISNQPALPGILELAGVRAA